jgi:CHAD domain-containing protein
MKEVLSDLIAWQYVKLELEFLELLAFYDHKSKKRLVHQIRLNLKKQLSFLALIKEVLLSESLEQYGQAIQKFQKRLGKVRKYQVLQNKLQLIETELGLSYKVSDVLKKRTRHYTHRWLKYCGAANIAETMAGIRSLINTGLPQVAPAILEEHVSGQMRHLLFEIKCFSNEASFDLHKFHDLRRLLKRFAFYWSFLQTYFTAVLIEPAFWNLVNQLDQALGEWHDYTSLLKEVDKSKSEALAFVVKEKLEDYSLQVQVLLPRLDEFIPTLESHFLSKNPVPL